jgi:hypothetical protein
MYDPYIGLFITPDPYFFQNLELAIGNSIDLNLFAYVRNNPMRFIDPTGYGFWDVVTGAIRVVSGVLYSWAGYGLIVTTGWTGIGAYLGVAMIAYGAQEAAAGIMQICTGAPTMSFVQRGGYALGKGLGMSDAGAMNFAMVFDATISVSLGGAGSIASGEALAGQGLSAVSGELALYGSLYIDQGMATIVGGAATASSGSSIYSFSKGNEGGGRNASTGRTTPNDLNEKLAMEQARSNPEVGKELHIKMKDPRWPGSEGWVKMSQNVNGVEIHYVRNKITGEVADFKFID